MKPILQVQNVAKRYGARYGCRDVSFELFEGEVLCIVGESGSGKSTLLATLAGRLAADEGEVRFCDKDGEWHELTTLAEAERRRLARTEWGFVTQHARDGLRMGVSAGANVSERLMALGDKHYGKLRSTAGEWLEKVEISAERLDDQPSQFSGGMQQRLQIARNLVTRPRLVFMDEPTGGLDVSVQARFLDLLRRLVHDAGIAVIMVTHDLGVARLLAHRTLVMQQGRVVEAGLTDQILDDPQHPYTQLLVSSIVQA
ncbi:phosphonate C-P lyase system protein PhnK [Crenobacter cavernae]|uniref:Phosphonate C-P lyase system protein PhnK n=1 Tax=Crenobacter cavernae TaxID=2290923 RepID=A0ABY0FJP1_9NEIS|nr:phosphonate C-P lyase system protein PhnK [Crenobacter cavernae]RXZ45673.1 phosphonate C-P lyase system protein PhnK [Crenobacter cavernae]